MIIVNSIFVVVFAVVIVISILVAIRNSQTHKFRHRVIDIVFEGENWEEKRLIYHNGPSYNQMMFSFKPLKLESFYTPEQIEILNK